jgi:hypothetical protein
LPPETSSVGGLSVHVRYVPSAELGGDFYDYAAAGPTETTLRIADAAGHGVSAAMLTGVVKAAFDASRVDRRAFNVTDRGGAEARRPIGYSLRVSASPRFVKAKSLRYCCVVSWISVTATAA